MKADFVPGADVDIRAWLVNLDLTLTAQGPLLGMSPAQVTAAKDDAQTIIAAIDKSTAQKELSKSATANKDSVKALRLKSLRHQIALAKLSPAYTTAIGKLMGVEAADIVVNELLLKPTISATISIAGVTLKFDKRRMDGVNFYSRRGSETIFSFLARDTNSPYVDSRENLTPGEERQYFATYIKDDGEIGLASDIITIVI